MNKEPIVLKGKIGDIEYQYEIKTKKDHTQAKKDLKALSKSLKKDFKGDDKILKNYKFKTNELREQVKLLEKRLKYSKNVNLINGFEKLVKEQIQDYKEWEIHQVVEKFIKSDYGVRAEIEKIVAECLKKRFTIDIKKTVEDIIRKRI